MRYEDSYEFKVKIYNSNNTYNINLPKKQRELNEFLDFYELNSNCNINFFYCKENYLKEIIPKNINIFTLNLLAEKLSKMDTTQKKYFKGMTSVEKLKNDNTFIPLNKMLNIAESVDKCQCINNVRNDRELAEFYYENNLYRELFDNLQLDMMDFIPFEKIGKHIRNQERGIYLNGDYIKLAKNIEQKYSKEYVPELRQMEGSVLLNIRYANEEYKVKSAELWLPASKDDVLNVLDKIGAKQLNHCYIEVGDSIAPSMISLIDKELREDKNIGLINKFAFYIKEFQQKGELDKYKAMIKAEGCNNIKDAYSLAEQINKFYYCKEYINPATYAAAVLKERLPEIDINYNDSNLSSIGKKLMWKHGAFNTEFGTVVGINESKYVQQIEASRKMAEGINYKDTENVMQERM